MPNRRRKKKKSWFLFLLILFLFILAFILFFLYKIINLDKFIYINNKEGSAEIVVVYPLGQKTIKILLDKDFLLDSSHKYGEYKVSSLWVIGQKNGLYGEVLAQSITKNFSLPVYLWKDGKKSNLSIFQKIRIYFTNGRNSNYYDYELTSKEQRKVIFKHFGKVVPDNNFLKLKIEDLTSEHKNATIVSEVMELLGYKTIEYLKGFDDNLDCEIISNNKDYMIEPANIFGCQKKYDANTSYDLIIRLGGVFADRF